MLGVYDLIVWIIIEGFRYCGYESPRITASVRISSVRSSCDSEKIGTFFPFLFFCKKTKKKKTENGTLRILKMLQMKICKSRTKWGNCIGDGKKKKENNYNTQYVHCDKTMRIVVYVLSITRGFFVVGFFCFTKTTSDPIKIQYPTLCQGRREKSVIIIIL